MEQMMPDNLKYWGPLATRNLKQNLLHDVRFYTRFAKT